MRWTHTPPSDLAVRKLQAELGVARVLAVLLASRLDKAHEPAEQFLDPRLKYLCDPLTLDQVPAAAARVIRAIERSEDVLVIGDYDVDGVTSTVLLVDIMRHFGAQPLFQVPRRTEEGYGLSPAMVDRILAGAPPDLLIALDCGTNAVAEVARLRERGIEVIIVDHHESKGELPADCLLVNPKLYPDCPCRDLCTAGLVFKLAHGVVKLLRERKEPRAMEMKLKHWLDLVALGTIADLVPLRGENRIYAREGLRQLAVGRRPGLKALMEVSGLALDQTLAAADVAYKLGPRLNAGGRLADATLPVELLLGASLHDCLTAATELDALNRERQAIERRMFEDAVKAVEGDTPAAVVVSGEDWHPGVVGIVAGRLARRYYRPAIALSRDGDVYKGSGRSIPEVDLQQVLHDCDALLEEWGGHRMAVGVTLASSKVEAFQQAFRERVAGCFAEAPPEPSLTIDAWMEPAELDTALLDHLDRLQPYGMDNPEPVLGLKGAVLPRPPNPMGKEKKHLKFELTGKNGIHLSGIAWNMAENPPPAGRDLDLAVRFSWNHWNGRRSPRVELVAWR